MHIFHRGTVKTSEYNIFTEEAGTNDNHIKVTETSVFKGSTSVFLPLHNLPLLSCLSAKATGIQGYFI
jgi:hypothetical protein